MPVDAADAQYDQGVQHTPAADLFWTRSTAAFAQPDMDMVRSDSDEGEVKFASQLLRDEVAQVANPENTDEGRYRTILTTIPRQLHYLSSPRRQAALNCEPALAGQPWDALLAAVCEYIAASHGHPTPSWCHHASRFLAKPCFLAWDQWFALDSLQRIPAAFIRHGVIPDVAEIDCRIGEPYRRSARTLHDPRQVPSHAS